MMNGAIFGARGRFSRNELDAMDQRLRHRGGHGAVHSHGPDVLLGWRGTTAATTVWPLCPLVCACSLLNRAELAALTGARASSTVPDAELLWRLYRAHGPAAFSLINGQFALALYDGESVILAVDSWASRPLSFATCSRGIVFATELKALLALEDLPARLNRSALVHLLATKYMPTGESLLDGVRSVAPGTWVRLGSGTCTAESYCPVSLDTGSERSEASCACELRQALLTGCQRLTSGLERVGISLSGGLDSTLTVGAVRAIAPDIPIYTYTAAFQPDDPTLVLARETATHFQTTHREIVIPVAELPRLVPEAVWTMEEPVAREEMIVYLVIARAAAAEVPYILHGHLSDMLFAGMPRHMLVHFAKSGAVFRGALLELYEYSQTGTEPRSALGSMLVRAYYRRRRTPPPDVLGAARPEAAKAPDFALDQPLNALLLDSLRHPTEIGCIERLHARCGLGCGSVFHDLDVARCAFRIPDSLKIRGLNRKYILRRAAEGILPSVLIRRPKDLIRMPRKGPLRAVLQGMAHDLLNADAVSRRGLFNVVDIARLIDPENSALFAHDHFYHFWTLLLSESWMRAFVDARGVAPADVIDAARRPGFCSATAPL